MDATSLKVGDPTSSAWREETLTRATELTGLLSWVLANRDHGTPTGTMADAAESHLEAAKTTARGEQQKVLRNWRTFKGSSFERALGNLDAAEIHLLRLAPEEVLWGSLPSIQAHVNRFLEKDDPRRLAVDEIANARSAPPVPPGSPVRPRLGHEQRDVLAAAAHAANTQRRRDLIRLRGFRNMLLGGLLVFSVIAIALGLVGTFFPTAMPLCFSPETDGTVTVVCPQGETIVGSAAAHPDLDGDVADTVKRGDLWLVEGIGLLAAALAGGTALRKLKGTSTPYGVPIALAVFKLPTGAVTAVVGLLLMRADFVPGLSALDTSAQILGWAVVFGIAQQLVTRFADTQAVGLLENVGGHGAAGDRPLKSQGPSS